MVALTNLKSLENKANTAISLAVVQNAVSNYSNTALGTESGFSSESPDFTFLFPCNLLVSRKIRSSTLL